MRGLRGALLALAVAVAAPSALTTVAAAADRSIDVSSPRVHRIFLPTSQSVTIQVNRNLGDMVVADTKIADAQPMTDRTLYVIGKGAGTTSINLFSEDRRTLGVIEVEVGVDVDDMAAAIRQVAPRSRITIGSVNGRVRLGGRVKDGAQLASILQVAQQYGPDAIINAIEVEDSQQVNLEVRVLEVSRNAGRELGVTFIAGEKGTWDPRFAPARRRAVAEGRRRHGRHLRQRQRALRHADRAGHRRRRQCRRDDPGAGGQAHGARGWPSRT